MLASIGGTISMGRRYLIAGTRPRVGKTTIACALGFAMRARGLRVGVMKPFDTPESQDAQALALAVGSTLPLDVICPYRAHADLENEDLTRIVRCFREIAAETDVVLVEASSGVNFPIFAAMLRLEVVLVVGNLPECVDRMKRAVLACEQWKTKLAGCILCDCEPAPHIETLDPPPGVAYLGRMRHREPLAKSIVEKLL